MDKPKIAVFNTQPPHIYFGGVERRIMETAKRLQTQAHITIYSGTKAGFQATAKINDITLIPCHSTDRNYPLDNWTFNRSLSKMAGTINADVYEAHAVSGYGFSSALKSRGIKKPLVHTIHGVLADEYEQAKHGGSQSFKSSIANQFMRYLARLERQAAQNATIIATISHYSMEKIQKHYKVEPSKIRIIPNGVDTEKFKPAQDTDAAKRQFGLGKEPCVLFVGNLIPRKGLSFLVEAAQKILREKTRTKFLIVGEGPLKSQLESSLGKANLLGSFKFLGSLAEDALSAVYGCADVFVLPSIQEGQGIVLLEAQASGKPVVAFDVGGANEAVRDGETGFLVKQGSSEALADALLKLLGDQSLRDRFGLAGRRFVSENYTWDICAQKMFQVYQEALAAGQVN